MFKNNIFNGIAIFIVIGYGIMMYFSMQTGYSEAMLFGTTKELTIDSHQYYRIFTSTIAHGGLPHLFMNMVALSSLGSTVIYFTNEKFSLFTFIAAALICGVVTSFQTDALTVGASGAIYGLFGILIYFAIKQHRMGYSGMLKQLGPIILINVFISFMPDISFVGHATGLIVGLVCSYIYDKKHSRSFY
ncbi:MAG: rhomboid family intramembrane serine protease [Erysipelotrichales bacterium]